MALEPEFWDGLDAMARARGVAIATLIRHVDETRTADNLSSALRIAVLDWYRTGAHRH